MSRLEEAVMMQSDLGLYASGPGSRQFGRKMANALDSCAKGTHQCEGWDWCEVAIKILLEEGD